MEPLPKNPTYQQARDWMRNSSPRKTILEELEQMPRRLKPDIRQRDENEYARVAAKALSYKMDPLGVWWKFRDQSLGDLRVPWRAGALEADKQRILEHLSILSHHERKKEQNEDKDALHSNINTEEDTTALSSNNKFKTWKLHETIDEGDYKEIAWRLGGPYSMEDLKRMSFATDLNEAFGGDKPTEDDYEAFTNGNAVAVSVSYNHHYPVQSKQQRMSSTQIHQMSIMLQDVVDECGADRVYIWHDYFVSSMDTEAWKWVLAGITPYSYLPVVRVEAGSDCCHQCGRPNVERDGFWPRLEVRAGLLSRGVVFRSLHPTTKQEITSITEPSLEYADEAMRAVAAALVNGTIGGNPGDRLQDAENVKRWAATMLKQEVAEGSYGDQPNLCPVNQFEMKRLADAAFGVATSPFSEWGPLIPSNKFPPGMCFDKWTTGLHGLLKAEPELFSKYVLRCSQLQFCEEKYRVPNSENMFIIAAEGNRVVSGELLQDFTEATGRLVAIIRDARLTEDSFHVVETRVIFFGQDLSAPCRITLADVLDATDDCFVPESAKIASNRSRLVSLFSNSPKDWHFDRFKFSCGACEHRETKLEVSGVVEDGGENFNCRTMEPSASDVNEAILLLALTEAYEKKESFRRRIDVIINTSKSPDDPSYLAQFGRYRQTQGCFKEAELLFRKALNGFQERRDEGDCDRDFLDCQNGLGVILTQEGKYEEAEPHLANAYHGCRRQFGDWDLTTLHYMVDYALLLQHLDRLEEAEKLQRLALNYRKELVGDQHVATIASKHCLSALLVKMGQKEEAEQLGRAALEGRRKILGDKHQNTIESMRILAWLLEEADKPDEASWLYLEAAENSLEVLGEKHPETLRIVSQMGGFSGDIAMLEKAWRGLVEVLGPNHEWTQNAQRRLQQWLPAKWIVIPPGDGEK